MATERQIGNARRLRRGSTEAEARLWFRLRCRQIEGVKFVRQFPIGPYIVDFCCRSAKLVVEVDGGQHADDPRDLVRTDRIGSYGYVILRFWNNDVLANTDGVLETIADMLRITRNS
jgi:very-short-patch-repair endonuclease